MQNALGRRAFLISSVAVAAGAGAAGRKGRAARKEVQFRTKLFKALICRGAPSEDYLKRLKDAGFHGVEAGIVSPSEAEQARKRAEKLGMRIHSVLRGWAQFNSKDPSKVEASLAVTEKALRAAAAYGADAVLLVPCRIGGMPMPRPWEFRIDFDPKTCHIRTVTAGDNKPFARYIEAHNHSVDTSREAVKRLIPIAEKTGVVIALENVWNNLWVHPEIFRNFVASFGHPLVKAYFDIGNHVKYRRPEAWILELGGLIAKLHVKDFKLDKNDPKGGGHFVPIREGDVRWPIIRRALDRVGYNGWMTIEGGGLSVEENSRRLDKIIAGV